MEQISKWLGCEGVGSLRINKFRGKVSSLNVSDCLRAGNTPDLIGTLGTLLNCDFESITIKRAKTGYTIHTARTVMI